MLLLEVGFVGGGRGECLRVNVIDCLADPVLLGGVVEAGVLGGTDLIEDVLATEKVEAVNVGHGDGIELDVILLVGIGWNEKLCGLYKIVIILC